MAADVNAVVRVSWPAPANVRAYTTTRNGGSSKGDYSSFNLGDHVGDKVADVAANRTQLADALDSGVHLNWLRQVHGCQVIETGASQDQEADGIWSCEPRQACLVMTADCLPVLLCDEQGRAVAALHVGWRGLVAGVVEAGVSALVAATGVDPDQLLAWLGPAIGPDNFEVGEEVRDAFLGAVPASRQEGVAGAFTPRTPGATHYHANLVTLAKERLTDLGVYQITDGPGCTVAEPDLYYSYRRDGETGRFASLVYLL